MGSEKRDDAEGGNRHEGAKSDNKKVEYYHDAPDVLEIGPNDRGLPFEQASYSAWKLSGIGPRQYRETLIRVTVQNATAQGRLYRGRGFDLIS